MILAYDADCGFCSASVDWLCRLKFADRTLSPVAYGNPQIQVQMPGVDLTHADGGVQLLLSDGRMYRDAVAIGEILAASRSCRWMGILIRLPGVSTIAQAIYRLIARNRRLVSRVLGLNACKVRTPQSSK